MGLGGGVVMIPGESYPAANEPGSCLPLISIALSEESISAGVAAYISCSTKFNSEEDIVVEIFREMLFQAASSSGLDVALAVPQTIMRPRRK